MTRKRIALAGLGHAARTIHLPAIKKIPGFEIVGGFDPQAKQEDHGFQIFPSFLEMLSNAKPDIVAVLTPPDSHFELARTALDSGCHVVCEKPFMPTVAEASDIVALAQSVGRRVVVNNQYRFMEIHRKAKQAIGSSEFGELLFLFAQQTFFRTEGTETGWRGEDTQRTCKEFGIHVFDLCRFFFGAEPQAITARMPKGASPNGPDYLNLIQVEFPGDRVGHVLLDRLCRGRHRYLDIRLDGTLGCLETHLGGELNLSAGVRGGTKRPFLECNFSPSGSAHLLQGETRRKLATDPLNIFAHATQRLLESFLDCLETGAEHECDGTSNLRTLAMMFAAYESAETGKTIELPS